MPQVPIGWYKPLDCPPYWERGGDARYGVLDGTTRILEISSASIDPLGERLSAMNLEGPGGKGLPLESVYQAAKDYGAGPMREPAENGKAAKRIDKDRGMTNRLRGFEHDGWRWPLESGSAMYDRMWIQSAVVAMHGTDDEKHLHSHHGFSDRFDKRGAVACQAKSAAIFKGLCQAGVERAALDDDPRTFCEAVGLPPEAFPTRRTRDTWSAEERGGAGAAGDKAVVRGKGLPPGGGAAAAAKKTERKKAPQWRPGQ